MIVQSIKKLRGRKIRYRITFDDDTAIELNEWTLATSALREGDSLTPSERDKLLSADAKYSAKECALNYLSYRPRSAYEISLHLRKKGYSEDIISMVVQELRETKFIDDRTFAMIYLNDQLNRNPQGVYLLRQRLLAKGIDRSIVDELLQARISHNDQEHSAVTLLQKKYRALLAKHTLTPAEYRKIYTFLQRKGFSHDVIHNVLQQKIGAQYDTE